MEGYFWRLSLSQCLPLSGVVCGDGTWIEEVEGCDDWNREGFDGCDGQCQVEQDFACDPVPSGGSVCRFTKEITLEHDRI